jgi:hypothetical protein
MHDFHLPWYFWAIGAMIVIGISMRRAAAGLRTFYGGLWSAATKNPIGSQVSRGFLAYFLGRIFR